MTDEQPDESNVQPSEITGIKAGKDLSQQEITLVMQEAREISNISGTASTVISKLFDEDSWRALSKERQELKAGTTSPGGALGVLITAFTPETFTASEADFVMQIADFGHKFVVQAKEHMEQMPLDASELDIQKAREAIARIDSAQSVIRGILSTKQATGLPPR